MDTMSSLTFGPKWVRDLSSGDTGAAAPPNTPPPRKYKLADFRYGREEMLALVSEIYELPAGLKDFEDIINERPVPPLAMIPLSEEEERCQMGGVNSLLVLKMTGRGTPGLRGRGGVRGRGRGRGSDYQISRSASATDEGYNQRTWIDTGHTRGGSNFHRPLGRGESADGTVRSGFEPRQRLPSDGSFPGRPAEYWRSNSYETSTGGSGGVTPTDEEGWPYKPWTGKKGSADNNRNWRDPKEPEPGEVSKSKQSWNRNNNTDHHSNSALPEWCNDDGVEDSIPGSFDATGQFRSFKDRDLENEEKGEENKKVSSDEKVHERNCENIESDSSKNDKKIKSNIIQTELKMTNGQKPPDSTVSPGNREASNSSPREDKEKLTNDKSSKGFPHIDSSENMKLKNGIDLSNEKLDICKKEDLDKELPPENVSPKSTQKVTPQSNSRGSSSENIQLLEKLKLEGKKEEEDDGLNIEHLTSMVEKLDDESDEDELLKQHTIRSPMTSESTATFDPSIVFAKKAEPGKSITGLQDWIYRDPQCEIQGPFTNDEMLEWFKAGYFTMSLMVRRVCDEIFLPLGDVMKLWGRVPFIAKDQRPPITNQVVLQHQQQQQQQTQMQRLLQQQQQHQQLQQQQQQQQIQQQQQQQQMREALLQQLQVQVDGKKSNDMLSELSVWGDPVNPVNPAPNPTTSPWNSSSEPNAWNVKKSPPNAINLRQIEEEQQRVTQMKAEQLQNVQSDERKVEMGESEKVPSPSTNEKDKPDDNANKNDMNNNNNEQKPEEKDTTEKEEVEKDTATPVGGTPTKKKNKKNKSKENKEDNTEDKKKQESEHKQKEKEEMQKKALEALKQQQLHQQKLVEQQRLVEEQNRREEEIRQKQQQQQQQQVQMRQQMLYQKFKQDQQRQQLQQQQQQQQQTMASTWNRVTPTTSAPSLAEIQRIQERKEAELHEHMKVLHHEQILQQQQQQRARWAQQQGYQQHQHRVKSLVEIQAEEAKKALQMQQQQQIKQHQMRQQQQQQQNYNTLPWNAAGQPIHAKPSKNDYNAPFWDEVAGIPPSRMNGSSPNSQQHKGQQNSRKGYSEFPPMSSNKSANKRDTKEQEIINRIFQVPTPSSEFISWVERNLPAVKKAIDVPTVVAFLQDVESPYEIHEYMRSYLGDSNEQKQFVREFLDRRNKTKKHQESNHAINMPGQAGNGVNMAFNDDDGFEESKRNKKKKKMQKVDPNLLGFQCNPAPELLNRAGEIESVSETVSRGKK